jgi:hypothetical protein
MKLVNLNKFEVSILLGYDTASLGIACLTFQDEKEFFLGILTPEVQVTTWSQNVRIRSPTNIASYPRRTESCTFNVCYHVACILSHTRT